MNKGNIAGWKEIFSFTLTQTLKNRAFIISFVILITLSMVSMPVIRMITSSGEENATSPSPVKKVYVNNKTTLPDMDFSNTLKNEKLGHISFETMQEEYDAVTKRIEDSEKDSVILTITESGDKYSLDFVRASKGPVNENSLQGLANAVVREFETFKINTMGITAGQLTMINAGVNTRVSITDASGKEIVKENTSISYSQYWFIYGILFIVMMVNIMASTQIATSIVTEKSTRVIEYLLISVKPLAIMVGKIFAMLTAVLLQVIFMTVVLFASNKLSAALSSSNGESVLSQYLPKDIFQNLNILNIIFCLILIVLGMVFYAALAGLAGATVSKIEELNEGLMLFTITNLIGVYIGLAAAIILMKSGVNGFVTFSFLFPLSSPFLLPGAILIGKVSLPMAALAMLFEVIFIILLFRFVAKIYETLILHNGNKIKVKDLIKISRTV